MKFFGILQLCLVMAVCAMAAPKASSYGVVDSPADFSGDRLFFVLDSVAGAGNWMEWDPSAVQDPSVKDAMDGLSKNKLEVEMAWVVMEQRQKPLLGVLVKKSRGGEALHFFELPSLDAKPVPLALNGVLNPNKVFRDYQQISDKEFVHQDRSDLKVFVTENMIRFTYEKKDNTTLSIEMDYEKKTFVEKKNILREFEDYFKYEYSLELRAFVQSTRGIFNWQPWHWYMANWNQKYMMSRGELEAILKRGLMPDSFILFKAKTSNQESVELRTNGNGFFELVIDLK